MSNNHDHIWEHHAIGPFVSNCFVFGPSHNVTMIDPGGPEAPPIAKRLTDAGIEIKHVVATHGHLDHLGWAPDVLKITEGATLYLHEGEKPALETFMSRMPASFGFPPLEVREPDVWLKTDQILEISGYKFNVIHTPGHSPGSAVFEMIAGDGNPTLKLTDAFVGDLIFEGAIGRFDLPFANAEDMQKSLKMIMSRLDPQSTLFPGHGNFTTMQNELQSNPFLLAIQRNVPFY